MTAAAVLRSGDGRLRLGWRLVLFAVVVVGVAAAGALVLPGTLPGVGAATLAGGLVGGWVALAVDGHAAGELGFRLRPAAVWEAALGLALGAAVALAAVGAMALAGGVRWGGEDGTPVGYLVAAGSALGYFALPAAAEEVLFRGYPLQALAEAVGRGPALLLTSVLFGLLHLRNPGADWIGALNVTMAGLLLGGLLLRTGSLWWASGAHLGWNWAHGFLADLPVSGLDLVDAPYVVGRPLGPGGLSGGRFGPEGSLLTTAVAGAAAAWVWWTPRLGPAGRGPGGAGEDTGWWTGTGTRRVARGGDRRRRHRGR
ncbi:MAG TPA: CPBP family intramembrane glutamic endopeptidase [Longimicrobiales bacterium]|nr:CPBP family intramembrane glutamic endopeptidase [Longimicrobiales bacterium]